MINSILEKPCIYTITPCKFIVSILTLMFYVFVQVFQERIEYVYILTALLIMGALSYGLYCNMPSDWQYDPKLPENRLTIIALALTLLVMSLLVCYHARYRLSIQPMNHRHSYEVFCHLFYTQNSISFLQENLMVLVYRKVAAIGCSIWFQNFSHMNRTKILKTSLLMFVLLPSLYFGNNLYCTE